jgi:UDP-glucose 4-epimerase
MIEHSSIVTGGAGFIGSHLAERLLEEGCNVTIIDDFSSGRRENIQHLLKNPRLTIIKEDLKKPTRLASLIQDNHTIYHLAANPEVRLGTTEPKTHFEENILATFNLLETLRQAEHPKVIVFASTSTVYGDAQQIPTPENYGPLIPISTYGASKLACEALIASYAHTFSHQALILRLANVIGPRSTHGVIADFIKKLRANPQELEILGDGTQEKSYLHVEDCVDASIHLANRLLKDNSKRVDIFNLGSTDKITVKEIARIVTEELHSPRTRYRFTGGVDGGRGWKGDVKNMQLSIEKLLKTGWKPKYSSQQAVRIAAKALIEESRALIRQTPTT